MKATAEFGEIVVFGARGHSLMLIRGMEDYWQGRVKVRALIDDIDHGFIHPDLGIPVISSTDRLRDYADIPVLLTPGSGELRARVAHQLETERATLATAVCEGQHHVDPAVEYGPGCLCTPYTRLGSQVSVGAGAQVLSTVIGHDVEIGNFSTLGVHSQVMGHVVIGAGATVAPCAVIANGTRKRPRRIGKNAVIGVGAVVIRDVPDGAHVVGNPAMPIRQWARLSRSIPEH